MSISNSGHYTIMVDLTLHVFLSSAWCARRAACALIHDPRYPALPGTTPIRQGSH